MGESGDSDSTHDTPAPANGKYWYYVSDDDSSSSTDDDDDIDGDLGIGERLRAQKARANVAVSTEMPGFLGFAHIASNNPDLASNHATPSCFKDVLTSPDKHHWLEAIASELESIRHNDTYDLIDRRFVPTHCNIIGFTWVFKLKQNKGGTIKRYKARCTAMGCSQVWGVDYDKTFAPVASSQSVRLLLALSQILGLQLYQYDVTCAFLNGKLPNTETVYMRSPSGSGEPNGSVWKLKRCIYGLKQASRRWNQHLHKTILSSGLSRCIMDPCVYHRQGPDGVTLAAIIVDASSMCDSSKRSWTCSTISHTWGSPHT